MAFPGERNGAALRSFPDHRNGDIEWNTIWGELSHLVDHPSSPEGLLTA
jgi:hypothetical protein